MTLEPSEKDFEEAIASDQIYCNRVDRCPRNCCCHFCSQQFQCHLRCERHYWHLCGLRVKKEEVIWTKVFRTGDQYFERLL